MGEVRGAARGRVVARAGFVLVFLLAAGLLYTSALNRSLWIDELITLQTVGEPSISAVVSHVVQTERRPPLYYLALYAWDALAGSGELSQRVFSIACLILSLPLVYVLGRRLGGDRVGRWSFVLTAASPFLILYSPMVRAYSMTLLLGCASTILLLNWLDRRSANAWAAYAVAGIALIYTDYVGLALVAGQMLVGLSLRRNGRWPDLRVLGTAVLLGVSYIPWIGVVVTHASREIAPADFSQGLTSYALKIGFPFYSFALGETVFPWHPGAVVGALAVVALAVGGVLFWRERGVAGRSLAILFAVPLAFTVFLLSSYATDITFLNVASRTALAAPFFYIFLAGGIVRLSRSRFTTGYGFTILPRRIGSTRSRGERIEVEGLSKGRGIIRYAPLRLANRSARRYGLGWAVVIGLAIGWLVSLSNLFAGEQYLNPIYALPMRQIAQEIAANFRPGDVAIADADTVLDYYLARSKPELPSLSSFDAGTLSSLQSDRPARVWLVTLGRDRTRDVEPMELIAWLDRTYGPPMKAGYVPQDDLYMRLKQRLLSREAYEYKTVVRRYGK